MSHENESSDLKYGLKKLVKIITKYVIFVFEISGIAENRIRDPVGNDSSISKSQLFYIKTHFFICHIKIKALI